MFDEKGFKALFIHSTGNNYCTALRGLEKDFHISIDDAFSNDKCAGIIEKIELARRELPPASREHRKYTEYKTKLKKYVDYKSGIIKPFEGKKASFDEAIKFIISEYKENITKNMDAERYKWEAVQWFQQHWNPDAENFAEMLSVSFSKAYSLLASAMYYPLGTVQNFAAAEPETVRQLFLMLYDESQPLELRYVKFREGFQRRIDVLKKQLNKNLQHYQDLRAIMVYLTFRYPEKYYFYKANMFTIFKERTAYVETEYRGNSIRDKLYSFNHMCDIILEHIKADEELIKLTEEQLNENCYKDENLHLLTMNLVFYGAYYMSEDLFPIPGTEASDEVDTEPDSETDVGLNTILYGPPGTGKTYQTVLYAVSIIEKKPLETIKREKYADVLERYQKYKKENRIAFTTFHQSFSYEEFIEGIRPIAPSEGEDDISGTVQYRVHPGIFKEFCSKAEAQTIKANNKNASAINPDANVWKVSLYGTGDNPIRTECLKNGHIRIGWDEYGKDITDETDFSKSGGRIVLNSFMNRMQVGDIVLSCYSSSTIDAIGIVTGEYEWHDEYKELKRLRKVNWILKDIRENILEANGGVSMTLASVYQFINLGTDNVMQILEKYQVTEPHEPAEKENYVFIIDEINRGNISKIFGELITLIEPSKRKGSDEEINVLLPYSRKPFGVPDNVYLLGTMNTADRSIAAIDTALRRRFEFKEILPDPKLLANVMVEDVSISELLSRLNRKTALLFDREHTIGHAYFMPLIAEPDIETLASIFENNIIPLLQEYFYEDYSKIRLVLGDNQKEDEGIQFIVKREKEYAELFGDIDEDSDYGCRYEINHSAFGEIDSYRSI